MRVLQVLPCLKVGGVERCVLSIDRGLTQAGHFSFVAANSGPWSSRLFGTAIPLSLHRKDPISLLRNACALAHVIKKEHIDLVNAHSRAPAWAARLACHWTHTPFITTVHGHHSARTPFKTYYNSVMMTGDHVITVSEYMARTVLSNFPKDRFTVIEPGINLADFSFHSPDTLRTFQDQYNLPPHTPLITMVGRFSSTKGAPLLFSALEKVAELPWHLLLIGPFAGLLPPFLEKRVTLLPHCSSIPQACEVSHLMFCPSIRPEAFGLVVAEAQAMGTPVITANHGCTADLVLDKHLCFEPGNFLDLARAIRIGLTMDPKERAAYQNKLRSEFRPQVDEERFIQQTLQVYQKALIGGQQPPIPLKTRLQAQWVKKDPCYTPL